MSWGSKSDEEPDVYDLAHDFGWDYVEVIPTK